MDALVPAFVVAALCEQGDRTQLLTVALAERYRRPGLVILGVLAAAALLSGLAAAAGAAAARSVSQPAFVTLSGLALVLAGGGALFRAKRAPALDGWRLGPLASSFGSFLILAFGDKTQFVVFALAGVGGSPVLAAVGAAAGIAAGNLPAAALGEDWARIAPLRLMRGAIGAAVVLAGLVTLAIGLGIA